MNIRELLLKGHAALAAKKAESEAAVQGHPRVGSGGWVSPDGQVFGNCHRKALARDLGLEPKADLSTEVMWRAGESNEWHWQRILQASGVNLTEVQIDVEIPGVPKSLLGHPDLILADETGKPVMGVELKGIFGSSTANLVVLAGRPKNDNLIQCAAYSAFTGLPFALAYTCANYTSVPFGERKKHGGISTIRPFYKIFYTDWLDGKLRYRAEDSTEWVQTGITRQGIEDYYRLVAEMKEKQDLGPRPTADYLDGTTAKYDSCGLCELRSACEAYDLSHEYSDWLKRITEISREEK
jgi:hypothetical protein